MKYPIGTLLAILTDNMSIPYESAIKEQIQHLVDTGYLLVEDEGICLVKDPDTHKLEVKIKVSINRGEMK